MNSRAAEIEVNPVTVLRTISCVDSELLVIPGPQKYKNSFQGALEEKKNELKIIINISWFDLNYRYLRN